MWALNFEEQTFFSHVVAALPNQMIFGGPV